MEIQIVNGDLISAFKRGEVEAIVQNCNCFCTMNSGIARTIREEFPEAYEADCQTLKGSVNKLGTFSFARNNLGYVFNLYAQYDYGREPKQYFNYEAFDKGLNLLRKYCELENIKVIGLPSGIGSGLARGDKYAIHKFIKFVFEKSDITIKLYEYTPTL